MSEDLRGSPALMSLNEPALKMLHERYKETFAITQRNEKQVHLFLIKIGLWSLVWTFTPRDSGSDKIEIRFVLDLLERTLKGESEFLSKLDASVVRANGRIGKKKDEFAS